MRIMKHHTKQLVLLVLTTLLALVGGFVTFPPSQAQFVVSTLGPWVMLATFIAFVVSLYRIGRASWASPDFKTLLGALGPELATVAVCGTLLLVHEPHGFKVLADEFVLLDTSRNLHYEREFFTPVRAHNVAGNLVEMGGVIDKRPFFFAFVLSLVHDLTGYRPANVFFLNGFTTFVLLGLAAVFGRQLGGRWGGILAVMLLSAVPLLGQNATGGGFELFNLMMISAVMLLARRYIVHKDDLSQNALVFGAVLLAQTRYESVLFVTVVGFVIVGTWIARREMRVTWPVILAPLMLVMYPLQNKVFKANPDFWQLPDGVEEPFASAFVFDNVGHAVSFFFETSRNLPNSFVIAALGIVSVGFLYVLVFSKRGLVARSRPEVLVLAAFGLVIIANFSLLMFYHWGQIQAFEVSRLSMPLHLLMVFSIVLVLPEFTKHPMVPKIAIGLAAVLIYSHAIPATAKAASTLTAVPRNEAAWQIDFLESKAGEDMLYICQSPLISIVHDVPGVSLPSANASPANIDFHLRMKTYNAFYVFQRFDVKPDTGELMVVEGFELSDIFETEVVTEKSFAPYHLARISRITGVKSPDEFSAQNGADGLRSEDAAMPFAIDQREVREMEKDPMFKYFLRLP